MSQIGSDDNPIVFRQTIVSTDSRFRKNYDRIFNKGSKDKKTIREYNSELEACRAKSKTFSMDQE